MINIRRNVFETNSSSSHSISIVEETDQNLNTLGTIYPDSNGKIILTGGQFGWEEETYRDPLTKANYCAVDTINCPEKRKMLIKVIKEHTGARKVAVNISIDHVDNRSYIDHQSRGTSHPAFDSETTLKLFIFSYGSVLETDNDNH
jgi:hypothetical protein